MTRKALSRLFCLAASITAVVGNVEAKQPPDLDHIRRSPAPDETSRPRYSRGGDKQSPSRLQIDEGWRAELVPYTANRPCPTTIGERRAPDGYCFRLSPLPPQDMQKVREGRHGRAATTRSGAEATHPETRRNSGSNRTGSAQSGSACEPGWREARAGLCEPVPGKNPCQAGWIESEPGFCRPAPGTNPCPSNYVADRAGLCRPTNVTTPASTSPSRPANSPPARRGTCPPGYRDAGPYCAAL
jgi:hypothetical protein